MSIAWEEELKVEAEKLAEKRAEKRAKQEKEGFALKMLKAGENLLKIVEYSGLSMTAVKRLAKTLPTSQ
ncbi:MAG: hypothetical protein IJT58_07580 [Synergistaceae bacterium]|nr:hypothetical protein [Synergistaceae bacterium]